jgi:hypothetical protein
MLIHFSDHLTGIVPSVYLSNKDFLLKTDSLAAKMDRDGKLYIVPKAAGQTLDSIIDFQVHTADVLADVKYEYPLSSLDFGRYLVYAICSDTIVSNIPGEFCVVPDTTLPILSLVSTTVYRGDSLNVSCNREGTICLVSCGLPWCIKLTTPSEILESNFSHSFIDSVAVSADDTVSFKTESLSPGSYQIYGFDEYGIVSAPVFVEIEDNTGIRSEELQAIKLFPNPVTDLLNLQFGKIDKYTVEIIALNGQLLHSSQMEGISHQIDLTSFRKGVYFITIRSEDFITTRKIIKL